MPDTVCADPMRLRQVLINFVGNAIKFTDSGQVMVRVRAVGKDGLLRFEVIDTGIGISEEAQAHIFNAFSQADSFTTRKYGGTGLGLAICRQLAALMGGEIGVRSEPNHGSTFWFEVRLEPAAEAAHAQTQTRLPRLNFAVSSDLPPAEPAGPAPAGRAAGPKILLVEDNPVNREVAVGMLESLGCMAHAAENGGLALEAMNNAAYDAVLMDCQMPVMDGLAAAAEIRRREQTCGAARVPIIALTANAMEGDRERCLAAGMDDFLSKPFTQQQLAMLLRRWLALRALPESERRDLSRLPLIDPGVLRNIAALAKPALLNSMIDLYLQAFAEFDRGHRNRRGQYAGRCAVASRAYAQIQHREFGRHPLGDGRQGMRGLGARGRDYASCADRVENPPRVPRVLCRADPRALIQRSLARAFVRGNDEHVR